MSKGQRKRKAVKRRASISAYKQKRIDSALAEMDHFRGRFRTLERELDFFAVFARRAAEVSNNRAFRSWVRLMWPSDGDEPVSERRKQP